MTDRISLAAARPDGPPQELINRLNETAAFHRPERLDADDAPEYTWREIREITDLLSEAAAALSASRTAQAPTTTADIQYDTILACARYLEANYGDEAAEFSVALATQHWGPVIKTTVSALPSSPAEGHEEK